MAPNLKFLGDEVPIVDVHYHYFAPHVLKPMGELVIASPEETPDAMAKLVCRMCTSSIVRSPLRQTGY